MSKTKTFHDIQLINNNKLIYSEEFPGWPVRPTLKFKQQENEDGSWSPTGEHNWDPLQLTLKKFDYSKPIERVEITVYEDKKIETWELYDINDVNIVVLDEDTLQLKFSFGAINYFNNT